MDFFFLKIKLKNKKINSLGFNQANIEFFMQSESHRDSAHNTFLKYLFFIFIYYSASWANDYQQGVFLEYILAII